MPDVERPPSWVPVDQGVGQVPMPITTAVDSSNVAPPQDANRLATEIIRQNQPVINRFVSVQRQQIEVGGLDIHSSILPLRDMTVYYSYVQGMEKMHYHLAPQAEAASELPATQEVPETPGPPTPEEPPEVSRPVAPEARVPAPEGPPVVPEEELPPEERPPEEEKPPKEELPEEEKKEEKKEPEFLEIDIPCYLPVEFGDGAGDP
jgi:hypothetical protein